MKAGSYVNCKTMKAGSNVKCKTMKAGYEPSLNLSHAISQWSNDNFWLSVFIACTIRRYKLCWIC